MTSNHALDAASKRHAVLVEFRYGDPLAPSFARYTNWTEDIPFGVGLFQATPSMRLVLAANRGLPGDDVSQVVLPKDSFTLALSSGEPFSRVTATISELSASDSGASDARILVSGRVKTATRNYQGLRGVVHVEIQGLKPELEVPLGMVAMPSCQWTFTERGCFVPKTGLAKTGAISAIAAAEVTITGLPAQSGKYWHRGYVERAGVRVGIRDWSSSEPEHFVLTREPPSSWLAQAVTVFPGCDRTIDTCRSRWNNEQHFGGFGAAMPDYDPLVQNRQ